MTPCHVSGKQMFESQAFRDNYIPVKVTGYDPYEFTGVFRFRKTSERIGYRMNGNTLSIPGYLFAGNPDSDAVLNPNDKLSVRLLPNVPAIYHGLPGKAAIRHVVVHAGSSDQVRQELTKNHDNTYDLKLYLAGTAGNSNALVESVDIVYNNQHH